MSAPSPRQEQLRTWLTSVAYQVLTEFHCTEWPGECVIATGENAFYRVKVIIEPAQGGPLQLPDPPPRPAAPPSPDAGEPLTKIERAIQLYLREPGQSLRKVASQVPCAPSLLARSKEFRRLRRAHVSEPPRRGTKYDGVADGDD